MKIDVIVRQLTSQNLFGKTQSDLDLKADEIIFNHLRKSGVVHSAASEEKPYVKRSILYQTCLSLDERVEHRGWIVHSHF